MAELSSIEVASVSHVPHKNAVSVWIMPLTGSVGRFHFGVLEKLLSEPERRHHSAFSLEGMPSLAAHALARVKAAETLCCSPQELFLEWPENQAPSLSFQGQEYYLSVTHASDLVAVAFSPAPVGIDVEVIESDFAYESTAQSLFCADEIADLENIPPESRVLYFHQIWTLKEAFSKASGVPFFKTSDMSRFHVDAKGKVAFSFEGNGETVMPILSKDWQFHIGKPTARHILSLAIGNPDRLEIFEEKIDFNEFVQNLEET